MTTRHLSVLFYVSLNLLASRLVGAANELDVYSLYLLRHRPLMARIRRFDASRATISGHFAAIQELTAYLPFRWGVGGGKLLLDLREIIR
jgi:hypothetical protein